MADFPNDLLPEILSKLPVKSLLRFRSVSKQFHRIIHDPKFVNSYNNRPESQISVISPERGKIVRKVRCSKDFSVNDKIIGIESNFPTKVLLERRRLGHLRFKWEVIGSFNGSFILENRILCRQRFWRFFFMLWNPSIRRFHLLPETPQPPERNGRTILYGGMGFDPSIEDYKYIGFGVKTSSYVLETVFVYTFGANSWKTIPFEAKGCPNISWPSNCESPYHDRNVCIRGTLYFIAYDPHYIYGSKTCRYLVFSYNLSTEEFSAAKFPVLDHDDIDNREIDWTLKCASDGSSLALVGFGANRGSIWWGQGEGGELSWSKRYEIGLAIPFVIGFPWRTYVRVLNVERNRTGGGEEAGVLLVGLKNCLKSYNVKTQEEKVVFRFRKRTNIVNVSPYVESLMLLNS